MHAMPIAFGGLPGGLEWVVIGLAGLLLFGKRLPGVARSLGQSLTEFKAGLAAGSSAQETAPAEETKNAST